MDGTNRGQGASASFPVMPTSPILASPPTIEEELLMGTQESILLTGPQALGTGHGLQGQGPHFLPLPHDGRCRQDPVLSHLVQRNLLRK
jgi:hypothetical protein